jgi:hypothetical protein
VGETLVLRKGGIESNYVDGLDVGVSTPSRHVLRNVSQTRACPPYFFVLRVSTPSSCVAKRIANARVSSLLSRAVPCRAKPCRAVPCRATWYCRAPSYCRAQFFFAFRGLNATCAWFVFGRACVYVCGNNDRSTPRRRRRWCTGAVSDLRSEKERWVERHMLFTIIRSERMTACTP